MELLDALSRQTDMSVLDERELRALAEAFSVEQYGAGHVFLEQGERSDAAWLILDGAIAVTRMREPYVDELERLGPGGMFGLAGLVADARRAATCRSVGPVTVGRIDKAALDMLMRDHAPAGLALQRAVARQLASDFRNIAERLKETLEKRG